VSLFMVFAILAMCVVVLVGFVFGAMWLFAFGGSALSHTLYWLVGIGDRVSRRYMVFDRWLRRISQGRRLEWPRWSFYLATPPVLASSLLASWALCWVYILPGDQPDIRCVLAWEPLQIGNITDAKGEVYFKMYSEARQMVRFEDIPETVRQVFTAAEDADFWVHDGWSKKRTGVAVLKAVFSKFLGFRSQGGSTITQQVDRRIDPVTLDLFQRERGEDLISDTLPVRVLATLKGRLFANRTARKWIEIKRAHHLEADLSEYFHSRRKAKEAILAVYLNAAYFGHGVYGVDYAAQFYFGKKLAELTVPEAAYLASLLPAPNVYAKLDGDLSASKTRRDQVLRRMADGGTALNEPLKLNVHLASTKTLAPAAVNIALFRELPAVGQSRSKLLSGSIQVQTTLRMDVQRIVNEAVRHGLYGTGKSGSGWTGRYPGVRVPQAAVVVLGTDGRILAMYGGEVRDPRYRYNAHMQLNRALSLEQPGSTFKIVDNMAAVMAGFTPDTPVSAAPVSVRMGNGTYKIISNYEEGRGGVQPLRECSAQSINTAYVRLMRDMVGRTRQSVEEGATATSRYGQRVDPGVASAIAWAHEMGITTELKPYLSTVLGGSDVTVLEMATVINSACTGSRTKPFLVSRITDNAGTVLYRNEGTVTPLSVPFERLTLLQELLYGNVRLPRGTAHSLDTAEFGIEVLGKTGTSNDWRDAWFCGCTHHGISIAVHVGYDDNTPMPGQDLPIWRRASGGWVALPIFREIIERCYGPGRPLGTAPKVPDVVKDGVNGYLAKAYRTPSK
jgi:membrane peptidoglycan carboxypeptidase